STVSERRQEYALFRALGATKKQLVTMVFSEFSLAVLAASMISLFLGSVFGYAMSLMTVGIAPFSTSFAPILRIPFDWLSITVIFEVGTMMASCYIPARRVGNINPALALRNL
ncbi:MAG: FtsX-like permease family protein, partial [Candidatus Thorarchaeota archaeon]